MQVALVTGAGSGIGRAVAQAFSQAGYTVALCGRRQDALLQTALTLVGPSLALPADIASADAARGVVQRVATQLGRVDVLVNNAGVGRVAAIEQTTDAILDEAYRLNALAPAWMTLEAWPHFARQHAVAGVGGCVINISSMASIDPFPGFFAYAGSKAAASIMASSIAKEGAAIGVRAFALAPGAVETPMLRAAFDTTVLPPQHALAPEHVAQVALDCAAGRCNDLNGRNIPVLPAVFHDWYRQFVAAHPPVTPR